MCSIMFTSLEVTFVNMITGLSCSGNKGDAYLLSQK